MLYLTIDSTLYPLSALDTDLQMTPALTTGAIQEMVGMQGKPPPGTMVPILQVLNVKPVSTGRYRAIISDGDHFVTGMLTSQTDFNNIKDNCIVRIDDFMPNVVSGRIVIILLGLTVLEQYGGGRIGQPVNIENASPAGAPAAAAPAPMQQQQQQKPLYNSTNGSNSYNSQQGEHKSNYAPGAGSGAEAGGSAAAAGTHNSYASNSGGSNPYGRASASASQQQHQHQAPIQRVQPQNMPNAGITAIAALNMYNNRWTIQARVTVKSDVRTWSNSKGEGSLFSVELLDSTQDIRATFFKEAVDRFYNMLETGKVYTFSGGRLKVANAQYNNCKSNFEITFDDKAEIHLCNDDGNIQKQTYEFVKIAAIEQAQPNSNVDVLAIVKAVSEPANLISKRTGQELTKCDLILVDDTGVEISLTLWGDKAKTAQAEFGGQPVAAFRRARVSDYNGKSLSAGPSTEINPSHVPEVQQLQSWWQSVGSSAAARSLSTMSGGGGQMDSLATRKTISAITQENLGFGTDDNNNSKPDWLSFKGTLTFLRKDKEGGAWYPACANAGEPCKNRFKMTQTTDGQWYCDKCQGTYPQPVRRWIFSGVVEDATGSTWISFFNEQAETLLQGLTADECYEQSYGGGGFDQDQYDSVFAKALFTEWVFKCKVKNEVHNEESRVKTSVYSLHPMDYVKESQDLLAAIEQF